jgi:hypothetical protein
MLVSKPYHQLSISVIQRLTIPEVQQSNIRPKQANSTCLDSILRESEVILKMSKWFW